MPTLEDIQQEYKGVVPRPVIKIAQGLGIEVFETDKLEDHQSGLIRREIDENGENKYVIYVNAKHPFTRKRFTIAHEIGHFLRHKDILDTDDQEFIDLIKQPIDGHVATGQSMLRASGAELTAEEKAQEIEANQVAAELLMPEAEFKAAWTIANTIGEIASKFEVSEGAAAVRAKELLHETIV